MELKVLGNLREKRLTKAFRGQINAHDCSWRRKVLSLVDLPRLSLRLAAPGYIRHLQHNVWVKCQRQKCEQATGWEENRFSLVLLHLFWYILFKLSIGSYDAKLSMSAIYRQEREWLLWWWRLHHLLVSTVTTAEFLLCCAAFWVLTSHWVWYLLSLMLVCRPKKQFVSVHRSPRPKDNNKNAIRDSWSLIDDWCRLALSGEQV